MEKHDLFGKQVRLLDGREGVVTNEPRPDPLVNVWLYTVPKSDKWGEEVAIDWHQLTVLA